jgi:hypothetical protein
VSAKNPVFISTIRPDKLTDVREKANSSADIPYPSVDLSDQMDNISAGFCPTASLFPTVPKLRAEAL